MKHEILNLKHCQVFSISELSKIENLFEVNENPKFI